jgi:ankyrin repeat protein
MFYLIRFLLIFLFIPLTAMEHNPTSLQFKAAKVVAKKIDHQDIARKLPRELQEKVNFLIKHYKTRDALRIAVAHSSDEQLIKDLIETLGNQVNMPDKNGTTELMYAAQCGNMFAVKQLIKRDHMQLHKNQYNREHQHVLHCAARSGNLEICKEIVDAFSLKSICDRENAKCQYPWDIAAEDGNPELCKYMSLYLINKAQHFDIKRGIEGAFINALCAGKPENAAIFFNSFCKNRNRTINSLMGDSDIYGSLTPLMWASMHGQVNSCKWLLDNGAQIGVQNDQGFTALSLAYLEAKDTKKIEDLFKGYNLRDDRQQLMNRIRLRSLVALHFCINAVVPLTFIGLCLYAQWKKH